MIDNLEDAIAHAKEVAEKRRKEAGAWEDMCYREKVNLPSDYKICLECAKEHEQLAEWLTELKEYREGKRTCQNCKYDMNEATAYPCTVCRNNHPNMFEWKEGE